MPTRTARTLASLEARVASGVGLSVNIAPDATLDLVLAVTAIVGTLTVTIETSPDELNWTTMSPALGDDADEQDGPFSPVATIGSVKRVYPDADTYVRASWAMSVGGSATFSVSGYSVRVYASPADMPELGIRSAWLSALNARKIDAALRAKTDDVTDAFASAPGSPYATPLAAWGDNIRAGVCACAAVDLMATEGTRPDAEDEKMLIDRCARFDAWLALVAAGKRGGAAFDVGAGGVLEAGGGATVILVDDGVWNF